MDDVVSDDSALRMTDLGHAYLSGAWVFRHYTVAVKHGSIVAILGPNGRGKTTLLKALLGVLKPTEGQVTVDGVSAFVPQLFHVTFDYTVLEMVVMWRSPRIGLFSQPRQARLRCCLGGARPLRHGGFRVAPVSRALGGVNGSS